MKSKHSRLSSFGENGQLQFTSSAGHGGPAFEHGLNTLGGRTYDLSSSSNYSSTNNGTSGKYFPLRASHGP